MQKQVTIQESEEGNGGLMYQQLRKFINTIDELRDVGLQKFIKLPRICVLGGQSAGKSSVLESVVGLDFLPRGDGCVTRRPLELRLNHSTQEITPWAKFDEIPDRKFTDFNQVREAINFLTERVCGKNSNILDQPIVLHVYSHTCPDLTMVDLPGITKIPMAGSDQPDNIEQITKNMAKKYCEDSRTIILCVIPANMDITLSDGLHMARELDPKGIRTIGVITKVDIMDQGTNAKRMIEGKDVSLRLGFIGIKNRSQQDIINRIPVQAAIEKEKLFFGTHEVYQTMPQNQLGCGNLIKKLTKILFTHIKHNLPGIMKEIRDKMKETESDLKDLGPPMPSDSAQKVQLLWGMITDFMQSYKNNISGKYDSRRVQGQQSELSGGARIKMSFYNLYKEFENIRATQEYDDQYIQKAIQMHEGDGLPGFPSVDVFIYLINPQLEKLRDPALELIQDTYQQLEMNAQQIVDKIFQRFPSMIPEIMEIITKVISKQRDHVRELVESIIDAELNYLFTNDLNYKNSRSNILGAGPNQDPNQQNQNQPRGGNVFVRELRQRIDSYFEIVMRNMKDSIPKAIGYFLVRKSQDTLQMELYNQINQNEQLKTALGEPERITQRRKVLSEVLSTLKNSLKVLQRDPDISSNSLGDEELEAMLRIEAMEMKQPQNVGPPNVINNAQVVRNREGAFRQPPPVRQPHQPPPVPVQRVNNPPSDQRNHPIYKANINPPPLNGQNRAAPQGNQNALNNLFGISTQHPLSGS